jgi:uncharacterized protein YraI
MRFRLLLAAAALIGALAAPTIAAAQTIAYTVPGRLTNMRAGPGTDFPVVAQVLGGSVVNVYGCLSDYSWCDSSVQGVRGWIATSRLEFQYAGGLVPIPRYYSYFDAPIIEFNFGYWDDYYRDRPFYRHRRGHRDRPPRYDPDGPGIFPEEGGGRGYGYSNRGRRGGGGYEGGGGNPGGTGMENRRRFEAPPNYGGSGIFPEEGGPPRGRAGGFEGGMGGQQGGAGSSGSPCPPGNPACQ